MAQRNGASNRRLGLLGSTVLTATLLAMPAHAQAPNAAPTGGTVTAGVASIAQSPSTTLVRQGSQRAVIDWTGFDVGSQHSVQFQQPSTTSTTLNRVTGPDPSRIAGSITANGQVVLVNQSGVVFSQGAQVNAQSLVVSTANISNPAFMAGGALHFDQPGKPGAAIVNQGAITVAQAGLAALVAPSVVNSGVITARLGRVTLAGATRYTLDLYGDGLLAIDVTGQVQQAPGGNAALVTNSGTILAAGGTVTLTAAAADGLVKTLVAAGGRVSADNAAGQGGTLVLDAVGGSISIEGALSATGRTGGQAQAIASDAVQMRAGSRLDVSGSRQGGVVALGTTLARATGGSAVTARTAASVQVAAGATIAADATGSGAGGRVTVLSTQATAMDGRISAHGGAHGGNGGFVEVSGQSGFALTGAVDVSAAHGRAGSILIDPYDLDVVSSATPTGGSLFTGTTLPEGADAGSSISTISDSEINSLGGNVLLQAQHDITFSFTAGQANSVNIGHALTLQAGGGISIDRGWSITTTGLTLQSGYDFARGAVTSNGTAGITIGASGQAPGAVRLDGGAAGWPLLVQSGNSLALTDTLVGATHAAGVIDLGALGGGVTQTTAGIINAATLTSGLGITGGLALPGANVIGTLGPLTVNFGIDGGGTFDSAALTMNNAAPLTITGSVSADPVSITTSGAGHDIALTSLASVTGFSGVTLAPTGKLTLAAGASVVGTNVTLTPGGGTISVGAAAADVATVLALGGVTLGGVITTGILEVAPGAALTEGGGSEAVVLNPPRGGSLFGLLVTVSGAGTATGTLRIGDPNAAAGNAVLQVSSITVAGATNLNGASLDLHNTGDVTQTAALTGVNVLSGAAGGAITLTMAGNGIADLGNLTAVNSLELADTAALRVSGAVQASAIVIGTTDVPPGISLDAAAALTATSVTLTAGASGMTLNGTLGQAGGSVTLSTTNGGSITQPAGGVLTANTLLGGAGIAGSVSLLGSANAVATLDAMAAGGNLTLTDNASLVVVGAVSAGGPTLAGNTGTLTLSVTGSTAGSPNSLDIGALFSFNGDHLLASKVALSAPGVIVEVSDTFGTAGFISANTLSSTGIIGGAVDLSRGANSIGTIDGFLGANAIALADTVPLTVASGGLLAGVANTPGVTLTLTDANNAVIVLGPLGSCASIATVTAASLALPAGGLVWGGSGVVLDVPAITVSGGSIGSVGSITLGGTSTNSVALSAGTIASATTIAVAGALTQSGGTLVASNSLTFNSASLSGGVLAAGSLDAAAIAFTGGTLIGGNAMSFANPQTIGANQSLASNGDITFSGLTETGGSVASAGAITVTGLAQSGGVLQATGSIAITGITQSAGSVVAGGNLTATASGAFAQNGSLVAGGVLAVTAPSLTQGTGALMTGAIVRVLASSGDAIQNGGLVTGGNVAIQAPLGTVSFGDIGAVAARGGGGASGTASATITCPDCTQTVTASVAAGATLPAVAAGPPPDVTLVGSTVALPAGTLDAGTLSLYSRNTTTLDAGALITATSLTGSAGVPLATGWTLPAGLAALGWTQASLGWTSVTIGDAILATTNAALATPILASYLTTGSFSLADGLPLTITGPVAAGQGQTSGSVVIDEASSLTVDGPVVAGSASTGGSGTVALTATGDVAVSGATTEVFGLASVAITSTTSLSIGAGAVIAAGVATLSAPTTSLLGAKMVAGSARFTGGTTSIDAASIVYANNALSFDALTTAGTLAAAGVVAVLGTLTQTGGLLIGATVAAEALAQSGGTVAAAGSIAIGGGPGVAGQPGSFPGAPSGTVTQAAAGALYAGGALDLWSVGTLALAGAVQAGGTIGATAAGDIVQSGGLIDGVAGVHLLSLVGSATQSRGIVAAGTAFGAGVLVQAPAGSTDFASFAIAGAPTIATIGHDTVALSCPACAVPPNLTPPQIVLPPLTVVAGAATPMAAFPTAAPRVDVTLLANSITLDKPLVAGTLALYARGDATAVTGAALDVTTLTGSSGVPLATNWTLPPGLAALGWTQASLGWTTASIGSLGLVNGIAQIAGLGDYRATGNITLAASGSLAITGPVVAGEGQQSGNVAIAVVGNLAVNGPVVATGVGAGGSVALVAGDALTVAGATTQIFAPTVSLTGGSIAASGGALIGGEAVSLAAPFIVLTGATVAATGDASLSGGSTSIDATSAVDAGGALALDAVTVSGTVLAAGAVTVTGTLTQAAGLVLGSRVTADALEQDGGVIAASGAVTIGVATPGGTIRQGAGGAIEAGGAIDLASSDTIALAGLVQAGGTIGATASGDFVQSGGTISGRGGVNLSSLAGNAIQSGGTLAAAGPGVVVQAPSGSNDFGAFAIAGDVSVATISGVTLTCPACALPPDTATLAAQTVTVPAITLTSVAPTAMQPFPAIAPRVDVTLGGNTIVIDKTLIAGTLTLDAGSAATETTGAIDAITLTGTGNATLVVVPVADVPAVNHVLTLAGWQASGGFSLTDGNALTVAGPVGAGTVSLVIQGDLTLAGNVAGTTGVALATTGTLSQTGGVVTTPSLTADAGGDALLTQPNAVATLTRITASGAAALTNAGSLSVTGTSTARSITLIAPAIGVAAGTDLAAHRIVLATGFAGGALTVASGATLDASGGSAVNLSGQPLYVAGTSGASGPLDQSDGRSDGVYLTIGSPNTVSDPVAPDDHNGFHAATGSGSITLGDVAVGGKLLRLALPDDLAGGASGTLGFGTITPIGPATGTVVLAWLGNGHGSGTLAGQQLGVLATSPAASSSFQGTVSDGTQIFAANSAAGAAAASQGLFTGGTQLVPEQGFEVLDGRQQAALYRPNTGLLLDGCTIASVNCGVVVTPPVITPVVTPPVVTPPVVVPPVVAPAVVAPAAALPQVPQVAVAAEQVAPFLALPTLAPVASAPELDFDLLLPDISDQEY